jgi:hypothetical protein
MALIDEMVIELQQEAVETGRVLEGVADEHLAWRPRAGAKTLGQIALEVATLPAVIAELAAVPTPAAAQPEPANAAALVPALQHSVSQAQQLLGDLDDEALLGSWRLMHGEREVFSMPRGALLRALLLDHWRQQRAELALYLRALGIGNGAVEDAEDAPNPFAVPERPLLSALVR